MGPSLTTVLKKTGALRVRGTPRIVPIIGALVSYKRDEFVLGNYIRIMQKLLTHGRRKHFF